MVISREYKKNPRIYGELSQSLYSPVNGKGTTLYLQTKILCIINIMIMYLPFRFTRCTRIYRYKPFFMLLIEVHPIGNFFVEILVCTGFFFVRLFLFCKKGGWVMTKKVIVKQMVTDLELLGVIQQFGWTTCNFY